MYQIKVLWNQRCCKIQTSLQPQDSIDEKRIYHYYIISRVNLYNLHGIRNNLY